MPTYKCRQCGKQFNLSIQTSDCQFCGSSQLSLKNRQSAGANFMINAATPRTSSKNPIKKKQKSIAPQSPPVYSSKAGKPNSSETLNLPPIPSPVMAKKVTISAESANFWEVIDPIQVGAIIIFLLLTLGSLGSGLYWLANFKFDTKDFQKVAVKEEFKTSQKWLIPPEASISNASLSHTHTQDKSQYVSLLKQEQFNDVDVSTEVTFTNPNTNLASGIATRVNGENQQNFYYLLIQADGSFAMGKHTQDHWENKVNWRKNSAIALGEKINHLRMVCKDNLIIGFINDQRVASFEDKDNLSGKVGLVSHQEQGSKSSVTFDNVLIKEREISDTKTKPQKPSLKQAIQQHYQNLENSHEHKSFNFVHNIEIYDQNVLQESDNAAQVEVGLRYSLKNGQTICESRDITLEFDPKINQWAVKKSANIRPQPACEI